MSDPPDRTNDVLDISQFLNVYVSVDEEPQIEPLESWEDDPLQDTGDQEEAKAKWINEQEKSNIQGEGHLIFEVDIIYIYIIETCYINERF